MLINGPGGFESQFSDFSRNFLDPTTPLSTIGLGSLGGKAQGLALVRSVLHSSLNPTNYPGIKIDIPSMVVIRTDVFDAFMQTNDLYPVALSDQPDDRIAHAFQKADLPFEILGDLRSLVEQVHTPLAVRSSSLLEDALKEPFAGIYETKMIPNNQFDPDTRFIKMVEAIKFIYASTFFKSARDYRKVTGHGDREEKMAVILQEIVGKRYGDRFYPNLSGVGRSYNYYPMKPARNEDGVVSLALGLGKTIVDGGISWTYSPAYPRVSLPSVSVEQLLEWTQNEFWHVNMGEPPEYDPISETEYMLQENLIVADEDEALRYLVSTYNPESDTLTIGTSIKGPRALTFAPLLIHQEIPLNNLIREILNRCAEAMQTPVEIEFAMTFDPHRFSLLQVRSMAIPSENIRVDEAELIGEDVLVSSGSALGNGITSSIRDIIFTDPDVFDMTHTKAVIPELVRMNQKLLDQGKPYILIVLGRLGTTDHWLGIPASWGQVCGAKVIVEATKETVNVELSQGTHYFHNIINLGVKYFCLSLVGSYKVDWTWLKKQPPIEQTRFLHHIELPNPLTVKVDGKSGKGVIKKP